MKTLKTCNFISERVKVKPITNAQWKEATKPSNNPKNIKEFKCWLSYYEYEYEAFEINTVDGIVQKIEVKDRNHPQYTINFGFIGESPDAYEFDYYIVKEGQTDIWYDPTRTYELNKIQDIANCWLDTKGSYKRVVDLRNNELNKARNTYRNEKAKGVNADKFKIELYISLMNIEKERLERAMKKYNSI